MIFRNAGADTIRLAVATFYDTSQKAIRSPRGKPVVVTGWYLLRPGDSLVQPTPLGPAVYYRSETFRNGALQRDSVVFETEDARPYTERLLVDNIRTPSDTTKFHLKLPPLAVCESSTKIVSCEFQIVLLSDEVKRKRRILINIGDRKRG